MLKEEQLWLVSLLVAVRVASPGKSKQLEWRGKFTVGWSHASECMCPKMQEGVPLKISLLTPAASWERCIKWTRVSPFLLPGPLGIRNAPTCVLIFPEGLQDAGALKLISLCVRVSMCVCARACAALISNYFLKHFHLRNAFKSPGAEAFQKAQQRHAWITRGELIRIRTSLLLCSIDPDWETPCLLQSFAVFQIIYVHVDFYICRRVLLDEQFKWKFSKRHELAPHLRFLSVIRGPNSWPRKHSSCGECSWLPPREEA